MAEVDEREREPEPIKWRLALTVAGPNYRDIVELESDDLLDLDPKHHDVNGLTYERYRGVRDEEFVEVRFDYIVARELEAVFAEPDLEEAITTDPDGDVDLPAELRVPREEP